MRLSLVLEGVNPAVADTVTELLFLAPENVVGQVGLDVGLVGSVESLAQDVLLDTLLGDHLLGRLNTHAGLKELLVQEGNTGFQTPGRGGLVGSQAIRQVQVLDTADSLLVELLTVGSSVEVKVSTEDLVTTLTTENHLDTHSLDLTAEQVHGGGSTDGGDIVSLQVVNDVREGVETVLDGESESMVLGSEELGHLEGRLGIGGTRQTNGEGVQLLEGGDGGQIVGVVNADQLVELSALGLGSLGGLLHTQGFTLSDGGDQAGVETTGEQDTIGDLSHQTLANRLLERSADDLVVNRGGGNVGRVPPGRLEVASERAGLGVEDVARRESLDLVANRVERLQLGSEVNGSRGLGGPADVEAGDTDGITSGDNPVLVLVVENPGEHAIQVLGGVEAVFHVLNSSATLYRYTPENILRTYQRNDDLTVGMRLELILGLQVLPEDTVVIDLAVDGQGKGAIVVDKGLGTRVCKENTLVLISKRSAAGVKHHIPTPTIHRRSCARTASQLVTIFFQPTKLLNSLVFSDIQLPPRHKSEIRPPTACLPEQAYDSLQSGPRWRKLFNSNQHHIHHQK